jgi:hypothetical protein
MKDKILWWQSRELIWFGIAKYFQENYDSENYAIIEIKDEPKKFFQEQKIVDFKKEWYFYDEISNLNEKPDLDYLQKIEEKYKINLWIIAYGERLFHKYNKYYKFSDNEILLLLEKEIKFYEKILDEIKPDFLFCKLTDFHNVELLYQICKARKIKILMSTASKLGNRIIFSQEADKIIPLENPKEIKQRDFIELQNILQEHNSTEILKAVVKYEKTSSLKNTNSFKSIFKMFLSSNENNDRTRFLDKGRTRNKIILNMTKFYFKKRKRANFINSNFSNKIPKENFILFPLHDEPERTTLITAPFFTDQLSIIKKIAKSIPIDYTLVVKEHPALEMRGWREISYYKEIKKLPNVILLHPKIKSQDVIKKSKIVITISGTAGLEAAFFEKPTIVFSDENYITLPSVYYLKNFDELSSTIKMALSKKIESAPLSNFVQVILENSMNLGPVNLRDKSWPFFGAYSTNISITQNKMNTYLKTHEFDFKKLSNELIKRLKILK